MTWRKYYSSLCKEIATLINPGYQGIRGNTKAEEEKIASRAASRISYDLIERKFIDSCRETRFLYRQLNEGKNSPETVRYLKSEIEGLLEKLDPLATKLNLRSLQALRA